MCFKCGASRGRVAPAYAEDLNSGLEQKAEHAVVGGEVEGVIFVDLRRRDDQRPFPDLGRRWRILDQLKQFVAEHDRARRGREVLGDLEGAGVYHRRMPRFLMRSSK